MAFCPYCGNRPAQVSRYNGEGDNRLATVLFADVVGFTAMSEHLPTEEVRDMMNRYFDAVSRPIEQYGGTIDKTIGDAIMAVFGAPYAHEDDPVRAITAGIEMQRVLSTFRPETRSHGSASLMMRIGINTGTVTAGEVGPSARKQFTVMGNTVNLASRLEHAAEPGSILVGESTYRLARHAFDFQAVPPMTIRGQSEPVKAYVPFRPRIGVSGSRPENSGRRLTFVGRNPELASLDAYLEEVRHGQGRLVGVVGEPGVGKSRLAEEFWTRHQDEGMVRISAFAPSFGENISYAMLPGLARSLVFGDAQKADIRSEELREAVHALLPDARANDAVAVLSDALGVSSSEATGVSHTAPRSRQAMLARVLKLLLAVRSRQGPVLLILEDMHWADSASVALFNQIVTGIEGMCIMVLMLHRPQFSHSWSTMPYYRQIDVEELPPGHSRDLLAEFLGSLEIPAVVGERVMEKAGGNPFFLEQIVDNLIESGAIVRRDGRWALVQDISGITVPDTIQGILLARLDQLSHSARSILEVAAVIGRVFAYRLLYALVDAESDVDEHLRLLQKQDLIFEKNFLPELEYMFKHSLTHDVVYSGLLEARRRALHQRVAGIVESLGTSLPGEQLPLLAYHYGKSTKWDKALEYAITAGERARRLYANQDAIAHFRQALEILERMAGEDAVRRRTVLEALGDLHMLRSQFDDAFTFYTQANAGSPPPIDRARLCRKLGDLAQSRGAYAEATVSYGEAETALENEDDASGERASIWLSIARMDRSRGALDAASATCMRALAVAHTLDEMMLANLYFELGEIERERGRFLSASGYLQAAATAWERLGALDKQALASSALAVAAFNRGALKEALSHCQRALEMYQRVADRQGTASVLHQIGNTRMAMGNLDAAIERYTEALAVATEIDHRLLAADCTLQLGIVYLERRDLGRAQSLLEETYATFKAMRNWRGAAQTMLARSTLVRLQGNAEQARIMLSRVTSLAQVMNDTRLLVQTSLGEAELEEGAQNFDRAAQRAEAAVGMARNLADARLIARVERVLGRVQARQGHTASGMILLAGSVKSFRDCGAEVDAARAALDYVVAGQHAPRDATPPVPEMLEFAVSIFERAKLTADLDLARPMAERLAVRMAGRS